jgi:HEAT repeat protein
VNDLTPDPHRRAYEQALVEELAYTLHHSFYPQARAAAAEELGRMGRTAAVGPLIEALSDENPWVRSQAAHALGRLEDCRAVPALLRALESENPLVREAAAQALAALDDGRAALPLVRAIHNTDSAVWALGSLGVSLVVPPLIEVLRDGDPAPRRRAAQALGKLRDERAVQPLETALGDADALVRAAAAEALGQIGAANAAAALYEMRQDEDRAVRWYAFEALGRIGDPRAASYLVEALRQAPIEGDLDVRLRAAEALRQITRHHPVRELRLALPLLRRYATFWSLEIPAAKQMYRQIVFEIEEATASFGDLPVPAAAPFPAPEQLPIPGSARAEGWRP